ncbi:MAG: hypothetical protein NVV62_01600 [Terricaulis sp.]|nr:hypothetical protein [Terricaulis sp.]
MKNAKNAVRGLLAASVAAATLMFGATAGAQQQQEEVSPHVQIVIDQFRQIVPMMQQQGYPNFEVIALNAINSGATETFNYTAQDNGDIVFIAVCDGDCTNLDMRVRNGGGLIGEDVLDDKLPMVQVNANARPLSVDTIMVNCTVQPCVYGLAVFRR